MTEVVVIVMFPIGPIVAPPPPNTTTIPPTLQLGTARGGLSLTCRLGLGCLSCQNSRIQTHCAEFIRVAC